MMVVAVQPSESVQSQAGPAAFELDRELMLRLRLRDIDAFERLYNRHHRAAFGLAFKVTGDCGLAEEVVQDAFLTIWRTPERFDPSRGSARGWLLSIIHHRSLDRLRRTAPTRLDGQLVDRVDARAADPSDLAIAALRRAELYAALDRLPIEQREAVELAFLRGRTHTEIARLLGCPLGTIKGRIRLGLQKLRVLVPA